MFNYEFYKLKKEYRREKGNIGFEYRDDVLEDSNLYWEDFEKVYEGEVEQEDIIEAMEDLFYKFNMAHPVDYRHASMSVGDVLIVDGEPYYVDSMGFEKTTMLRKGNV